MMKIFLLHPEPMPRTRNRAVFQRPLMFASHFDLSILTLHGVSVCDEITSKSKIIRLSCLRGRIGKMIWKVNASLWLIWYAIFHPNCFRNVVVYAFPQWGWSPLIVAKVLGYITMVDMQHTPTYYSEYAYVNRLGLWQGVYCRSLGWCMTLMAKLLMRHLDLVISMSHANDTGFSKLFLDRFHVNEKKLLSIPNGIEFGGMVSPTIKLTNRKVKVVYAGNIQSSKVENVLANIQTLNDAGTEIEFHIAGRVSQSYMERFKMQLDKYSNAVFYHGYISHDELIELYKECDFGLFVVDRRMFDHNHSHPGKVFEYMLYGCLPIATRIDSLKFVIQDGKNGFLIDNEDQLIDVLKMAIADPEMCNRMRREAFVCLKNFEWEKLNQKLQARMQLTVLERE